MVSPMSGDSAVGETLFMETIAREKVERDSGETIASNSGKQQENFWSNGSILIGCCESPGSGVKFRAPHFQVNTPHQCARCISSMKFYDYLLDRLMGVLYAELIQDLYIYAFHVYRRG